MKREQRGPLPPTGGYQPRERGRGTGAVDTLRETSMAEGRRKTPPRPREETDDRRSAKQHSEQQAIHWALAKHRTDQLPVPIEAGRAAAQGLHVIRGEHPHDRVELTVAEPREAAAEPDRLSQLRCQAVAPPPTRDPPRAPLRPRCSAAQSDAAASSSSCAEWATRPGSPSPSWRWKRYDTPQARTQAFVRNTWFPAARRTPSSSMETSLTRTPVQISAPASLACAASPLSKSPRSMARTCSRPFASHSMSHDSPPGECRRARLSRLSTTSSGILVSSAVSSEMMPVQ